MCVCEYVYESVRIWPRGKHEQDYHFKEVLVFFFVFLWGVLYEISIQLFGIMCLGCIICVLYIFKI